MVRQRISIRSRIFSVYSNSTTAAVVDDSVLIDDHPSLRQRQQQRKQLLVITFRQFIIGFTLFSYVTLAWLDSDASFLRRLRFSNRSSSIGTLVDHSSPVKNNNTFDETTFTAKHMKDAVADEGRYGNNDYPSLNIEDAHVVVNVDLTVPNTVSDLSVAIDSQTESTPAVRDACHRMKNEADIRQCYASKDVKKFSDPQCQTIQSWNDVQHCLMGRYHYPNNRAMNNSSRIREVHIVGERNSGTKFITQFLQQCYPKTSKVRVHRDFIRSKHFFQPIHDTADYSRSLIVVVVRDPIEWMAAMREFPYHSPSHMAGFRNSQIIPLPWQEFVNKTWTTDASVVDRKLTAQNRTTVTCSQNFRYDEVKPCVLRNDLITGPPWNIPSSRLRGYYPLYEQRRGKPYDHLLQLRSDKIVNWILQIPLLMKIGGFVVVRYEDILERGNEFFLQQVNALLSNHPVDSQHPLPKHCSVIAPQPDRIGKRYISPGFRDWINRNLDEETEHLVGYR